MNANVTHFREGKDNSTGEVVTLYILNVEPVSGPVYSIPKRYSDFQTIYNFFKDTLPPDYRFPNKSMFHNGAQFTKERRVRGFQELLQLLLKHHPNHDKVREFLRYYEKPSTSSNPSHSFYRGSKDLPQQPHMSASRIPKDPTGAYEVGLRRKLDTLAVYLRLRQSEYFSSEPITVDDDTATRSGEIFKVLKTSTAVSAVAYGMLVALNIVDASEESYAHMFQTVLALGMLITFVSLVDRKKSVP